MPNNSTKSASGDNIVISQSDDDSLDCNYSDKDLEGDLKMLHVDSLALLEKAAFRRRAGRPTVTSTTSSDDDARGNKNHSSMSDEELYGWFLETKLNGDGDDDYDDSLTFSQSFSRITMHNGSISNMVLQPAPRSMRNAKDEKAAKTA